MSVLGCGGGGPKPLAVIIDFEILLIVKVGGLSLYILPITENREFQIRGFHMNSN
jgi:hypothetical protein